VSPAWVTKAVVLAIHDEQLAEHGGLPGIRDEGILESGLDRPKNILLHSDPDIFDLAAAYACGVGGHSQPFVDGNKRVSAVITELFLDLNGYSLDADDAEIVSVWKRLADNKITQEKMAEWLRKNSTLI
jgi:death on curing protein